jgi:hypothetical protein
MVLGIHEMLAVLPTIQKSPLCPVTYVTEEIEMRRQILRVVMPFAS